MAITVTTRGGKGSALTQAEMDTNLTQLARSASEAQEGNVELATVAEAEAGTDTSRAVTPAGLKAGVDAGLDTLSVDFTDQQLSSDGYQTLPGGLILQWGDDTVPANTLEYAVTFPKEFPTAVFQFLVSGAVTDVDQTGAVGISNTNPTTTTGYASNSDTPAHKFRWFAIGN